MTSDPGYSKERLSPNSHPRRQQDGGQATRQRDIKPNLISENLNLRKVEVWTGVAEESACRDNMEPSKLTYPCQHDLESYQVVISGQFRLKIQI